MRCVHEEINEEQGVREAMLAVGDPGPRPAARPADAESTIAKFLDRNGPGVQQVAYTRRGRRAARATLRERGLRLLYDAPRRGTAAAGSTSSTRRTPAGCWSSWSSRAGTPATEPGHSPVRVVTHR